MTADYNQIVKTSERLPEDNQFVWYWFDFNSRWYLGKFVNDRTEGDDGEPINIGYFISLLGYGFLDHYDAPYWMPFESFWPMTDPRYVEPYPE